MQQREKQQRDKKIIPVEQDLFTLPGSSGENSHLIGSKCRSCGATFFPKRVICGKCYKDKVEDIELSRKGKIITWTTICLSPPGYKGKVPYVLGEVQLPEDVVIRTQFTGVDPENPAINIGDELEMVIEKMYEDDEGNDVVCYMFSPAVS